MLTVQSKMTFSFDAPITEEDMFMLREFVQTVGCRVHAREGGAVVRLLKLSTGQCFDFRAGERCTLEIDSDSDGFARFIARRLMEET